MVTMVKAAYSRQDLSRECRESPVVIALKMSNVHLDIGQMCVITHVISVRVITCTLITAHVISVAGVHAEN